VAALTAAWLGLGRPGSVWWWLLAVAGAAAWTLRPAPAAAPLGSRDAAAPAAGSSARGSSPVDWGLILGVEVFLFDALASRVYPVRRSDEADIWAAKAKVLFAAPAGEVSEGLHHFALTGFYPSWNPLIQALVYGCRGEIVHFDNRLPIQLFGVAMLMILASALRRRTNPWLGALVLAALVGPLMRALVAVMYSDLMLACAAALAAESLLRWREEGGRAWWRLACVAMAGMLAAKNEGELLVPCLLVAAALSRALGRPSRPDGDAARVRPRPTWLLWLSLPLAAVLARRGFNAYFDLGSYLEGDVGPARGVLGRFLDGARENGAEVLAFFGEMSLDPSQHGLLLLLFPLAFAVSAASRGLRAALAGPAGLLFLAWAGAMSGYLMVFIGTNSWQLHVAAPRVVTQALPWAAVGACAALWPRRSDLRG
ncbi:MAG: glycosyltransferase family 39 protein, partial [Planctomycetota bacterium]